VWPLAWNHWESPFFFNTLLWKTNSLFLLIILYFCEDSWKSYVQSSGFDTRKLGFLFMKKVIKNFSLNWSDFHSDKTHIKKKWGKWMRSETKITNWKIRFSWSFTCFLKEIVIIFGKKMIYFADAFWRLPGKFGLISWALKISFGQGILMILSVWFAKFCDFCQTKNCN